jgi:hypothetical protein
MLLLVWTESYAFKIREVWGIGVGSTRLNSSTNGEVGNLTKSRDGKQLIETRSFRRDTSAWCEPRSIDMRNCYSLHEWGGNQRNKIHRIHLLHTANSFVSFNFFTPRTLHFTNVHK